MANITNMKKKKALQKIAAFIIALPMLFFVELENLKRSDGQQKLKQVSNKQFNDNLQPGDGEFDTSFPVFINSKFIILNY